MSVGGGGGGGALNLSLLSRGIGEVQKNGHEKVEVFLEPSDYYNFSAERPSYYLSPLQTGYQSYEASPRLHSTRSAPEIPLPKTFTTRKGALLLFSEDLALRSSEQLADQHLLHGHHEKKKQKRHHPLHASFSTGSLPNSETEIVLKTVDDLAKSILHYGSGKSFEEDRGKMYLKFLHRRREQWDRQIRPGYSAKRYLSTWTRNWDDHVFETVVSKGYLTERSLFHYNMVLPNIRRQLYHEDLSIMPQPYRLMKTMLLSPGSLSGYTFYRAPGRDFGALPLMEKVTESDEYEEQQPPPTGRSIRVIRTTKDGQQREVSYADLDRDMQREVITDLLVKSAVHYALSKQEEMMDEELMETLQSEQAESTTSLQPSQLSKTPARRPVPSFDMRQAVISLLDSTRGPVTLGADLPDIDSRSHSSDHSGSFRGGSVPHHAIRAMGARSTQRASWPMAVEDGGSREFQGDIPVAAVRDVSASSSRSSVLQLPAITRAPLSPITRVPLSPIRDVSRETTQLVSLPPIQRGADGKDVLPSVHVMPPTPQHTTLLPPPPSVRSDQLSRVTEAEASLAEVTNYNINDRVISGGDHSNAQKRKGKGKSSRASEESPCLTHGLFAFPPPAAAAQASHVQHGQQHSARSVHVTHGRPYPYPHYDAASVGHSHAASSASSSSYGHAAGPGGAGDQGHGQGHVQGRLGDVWGPRTARSLVGVNLDSKSLKGSMIMAPDGEIISVGGSVGPPRPVDVAILSDVTQQPRHLDVNITYDSDKSDDEPAAWKMDDRIRKAKSMSCKKSDSQRGMVKRESQASLASGAGSLSSTDKGDKETQSTASGFIIKPFSVTSRSSKASQPRSSITEQEILDTLTAHAQRIAESVLSNKDAGLNLETDVKDAIGEIMAAQRSGSSGPTSSEYKDLIRQSLTTAVAKAAGLDPDQLPEDAEISPELLEALASQRLNPEDIAIFLDAQTGRHVIRSRQEIAEALGGVAEGHIYLLPGSETGGARRQMSIPADRASLVDNLDYDVINYGAPADAVSDRGGRSKAGSVAAGEVADLKDHATEQDGEGKGDNLGAESDEFQRRLQQMSEAAGGGDKGSDQGMTPGVKAGEGAAGDEPGEAGDQKVKEAKSKKKPKSPEEPFVADKPKKEKEAVTTQKVPATDTLSKTKKGMPKTKDLSQLYGTQGPGVLPQVKMKKPAGKGKAGKGKKGAKKGKKEADAETAAEEEKAGAEVPPVLEKEAEQPPPALEKESSDAAKPTTASSSDRLQFTPDQGGEESDGMEFKFNREEFSPEPDHQKQPAAPPPKVEEEEFEEEEEEAGDDDESALKSISNREARAAKRAAAAAKRKEEVERKRREREEQIKREKEEQERQEQLRKEMETERLRREEERRQRKMQEEADKDREERELQEEERKKQMMEDKEKRAKEDYLRKLEEMKRRQLEEDQKRLELQRQREKEEEERRAAEEFMLSQMAEQERIEYERKKREEEEERKKKEEEDRKRREEEARLAMEEARRLAEEMARRQAELEARLRFNRSLQAEASGLDHSHDINRAFVFSYFELLQWLGLDIPEFELAKLNQL